MNEETRLALVELSRRFYEQSAESFDASRQRPWPGWRRLLPKLAGSTPLHVLDAGCGNGRFGRFLADELQRPLRYHGVDASARLLAAGAEAMGPAGGQNTAELEECELELWLEREPAADFELVALFGVLHHIPSRRHRRGLLDRLGARLSPGGLLAATWWMLHRGNRFEKKMRPWSRAPEIDTRELESGDTLLGWRDEISCPRYAHFPDSEELDDLTSLPGLVLLEQFHSDGPSGRDNLYRIYRRNKAADRSAPFE